MTFDESIPRRRIEGFDHGSVLSEPQGDARGNGRRRSNNGNRGQEAGTRPIGRRRRTRSRVAKNGSGAGRRPAASKQPHRTSPGTRPGTGKLS